MPKVKIPIRYLCKALALALALLTTQALGDSWAPKGGHTQIPIWPSKSPILADGVQKYDQQTKFITDVSLPTYTVYQPKRNPSGTCVVVFPGGGHVVLAMGIEGTDVAHWLNQAGITCVLVKYRVPYSGCYWDGKLKKHVTPKVPMALQDAQRTLSVVRSKAKALGIRPDKIGVMGFSAGGNVAVLASTETSAPTRSRTPSTRSAAVLTSPSRSTRDTPPWSTRTWAPRR